MPNLTAKFTYANVAATLALVFSMTGGALAANHYLINSKNEINPKVLKALKGAKGRKGSAGAAGPSGPAGPTGSPGGVGPIGATGREGKQGQGLNGEQGLQGEAGDTGPTGSTGARGATGPTGEVGERGPKGKQGPEGKQGVTGEHGATGEKGGTGPTGETSNAVAYAHVSEKDILLESKNVGKVKEAEAGIFCLSEITGTLHSVQATIDYNESVQLAGIRATLGTGQAVCPVGTDVTVETFAAVLEGEELNEKEEPQGFFVTVF